MDAADAGARDAVAAFRECVGGVAPANALPGDHTSRVAAGSLAFLVAWSLAQSSATLFAFDLGGAGPLGGAQAPAADVAQAALAGLPVFLGAHLVGARAWRGLEGSPTAGRLERAAADGLLGLSLIHI